MKSSALVNEFDRELRHSSINKFIKFRMRQYALSLLRSAESEKAVLPLTWSLPVLEMQKKSSKRQAREQAGTAPTLVSIIEPSQHIASTARSPAVNKQCIVIASPDPSMIPALLFLVSQKAWQGLNFELGLATSPQHCTSPRYIPVLFPKTGGWLVRNEKMTHP